MKRTLGFAIRHYRNLIISIACVIVISTAGLQSWESSGQGNSELIIGHTRFQAIDRLVSFFSNAPGTFVTNIPISGLGPGEDIVGIDFRPATLQLYGVATDTATSRVIIIDPTTGQVTTVGTGFTPALPLNAFYGVDFDPVADRLRVVITSGANIRLHPDTGLVDGHDAILSFGQGDPGAGQIPFVDEIAYTVRGSAQSTLYGGDATTRSLVRVGGVNGNPPANGGQLSSVGAFGLGGLSQSGDMDIGASGQLFAVYNNGLFVIDIVTGQATPLGNFPTTTNVAGIAVVLPPTNPAANFEFPIIAVGADTGGQSDLVGFNSNGEPQGVLNPFGNTYRGGTTVATGDVNSDGVPDIIAGMATADARVVVFNGEGGGVLRDFNAFPGFTGGVRVAAGDVNADGRDDIIVGTGPGGGGHVKVFNGVNNTLLHDFFAFGQSFNGGIFVGSGGDVNADGSDEVIIGAGPGSGPLVKVFSGASGLELSSFLAYDTAFLGGVFVAAGDVDGDGRAEIVTGAGAGGGPDVKVFSGATGAETRSIRVYPAEFQGGVRVAVADVNDDNLSDIVAAAGPGGGTLIRVFDGPSGIEVRSFFVAASPREEAPFGASGQSGFFVAAAGRPTATISGRVTTPSGLNLRNALVVLTNAQGIKRTATTSSFGLYAFANVTTGQTYTMSVGSKRYRFAPRMLAIDGNLANVDFVGLE